MEENECNAKNCTNKDATKYISLNAHLCNSCAKKIDIYEGK